MDFVKLVPASNTLANYLDLNADVVATRGLRWAMGLMVKRAYDRGFVGCFCREGPDWARKIEAYEADRFRRESGPNASLLDQIGSRLQDGSGKRSPPLALATRFDPRALRGNQAYGNCTAASLGWDAMNMLNAIEVAIKEEPQRFGEPFATALIYGSRGHGGQGMALSTAANTAARWGVSRRKLYCGRYDCREEDRDENYGNSWGDGGVPQCLADECKADGVVTKVGSLPRLDGKMLKDLLYSGVMIHHGGTLTGTRSGDPLTRLTDVGPHAQTTLGYDDTDEAREHCSLPDDEFVVFQQQTWGDYFSISRWRPDLWGDYVPGTWPLKASDALWVVNQGGYGYYTLDGLKPSDLDWSDILEQG